MKKYKIFLLNLILFGTMRNVLMADTTEIKDEKDLDELVENNKENGIEDGKLKDRGIEKMNFYIPISEQNKYSTFVEVDFRNDKNLYQWTLAEGYLNISKKWDFNYKIEKEFHRGRNEVKKREDADVWDNEVYFSRKNKNFQIGKRDFNSRFVLGMKHSENEIKISNRKNKDYKYYTGMKISTMFPNFGKGGTYAEVGLTLNGVKGNLKDGYSILSTIGTSSSLGYGFQWINSLENEYLHYNRYEGDMRTKWETVFKWTYELNENWAFSPETTLKMEKYFSDKEDAYTIEMQSGIYALCTQNISKNLRVFGKVGPAYRYDKSKYGDYRTSKSQVQGYAKLGLEYVF